MIYKVEVKCPHCHNLFEAWEEEQTPGFRMKDELFCPYCNKFIMSSMEYEWIIIK